MVDPVDLQSVVFGGWSNLYKSLNGGECSVATDVTLQVGSSRKQFNAHRLVLSLHSPVLKATLLGEMREAKEGCVSLPLKGLKCGVEENGETFQLVVQALYTGKAAITEANVTHVLELAEFFQIEFLNTACVAVMEKSLSVENVCTFLESSTKYTITTLTKTCTVFLKKNVTKVLETKAFVHISKQTISKLLQFDDLGVQETMMFEGLVKWGKARAAEDTRADLKSHISDLLPHIKFSAMSPIELTQIVMPTKVVSSEVLVEAFSYQAKQEYTEEKEPKFCHRPDSLQTLDPQSTLLTAGYQLFLQKYLGPRTWKLLYKAKRDGFALSTFHSKIKNLSPYVMLFKAKGNNSLFGGYTSTNDAGQNGAIEDMSAFLFSLVDVNGSPSMKCYWKKGYDGYAFYWHSIYGPLFGTGHDICVNGSAIGSTPKSYMDTQSTFTNQTFGGSPKFQLEDYEVFQVMRCD